MGENVKDDGRRDTRQGQSFMSGPRTHSALGHWCPINHIPSLYKPLFLSPFAIKVLLERNTKKIEKERNFGVRERSYQRKVDAEWSVGYGLCECSGGPVRLSGERWLVDLLLLLPFILSG